MKKKIREGIREMLPGKREIEKRIERWKRRRRRRRRRRGPLVADKWNACAIVLRFVLAFFSAFCVLFVLTFLFSFGTFFFFVSTQHGSVPSTFIGCDKKRTISTDDSLFFFFFHWKKTTTTTTKRINSVTRNRSRLTVKPSKTELKYVKPSKTE